MVDEPSNLGRLSDHPYFRLAVPTPDRFLPLAYLAGVASSDGQPPNVLIDGYTMGSLSMACYTVGALIQAQAESTYGAPPLLNLPGDETNM